MARKAKVRVGHVDIVRGSYGPGEDIMQHYVDVGLTIGRSIYTVSCLVGVRDCMWGTLQAAGCGISYPHITAWFSDYGDRAQLPVDRVAEAKTALIEEAMRLYREAEELSETTK